jgi:hypothetical protein
MQKRSSRRPTRRKAGGKDPNQQAASIIAIATGQPMPEKNPAAVALGRLGGLKGGKARKDKLTPEERHRIASDAARARWKKARLTQTP